MRAAPEGGTPASDFSCADGHDVLLKPLGQGCAEVAFGLDESN
jgi:hypothetical protein